MTRRRQLMAWALDSGLGAAGLLLAPSALAAAAPARIGWVSFADPGVTLQDFRSGLREHGAADGADWSIEVRVVRRDAQAVQAAMDELIALPVLLVVAQAAAAPLVSRAAGGRIPVLFAFSGDPVEAGLVRSLAQPGGMVTGVSFLALELVGKRLELLKQLVPHMTRVAVLANPQHPGEKAERRESLLAAERLGLAVAYVEADPSRAFDEALEWVALQRCEGLIVFPDAGMLARAPQIAAFALKHRIACVSAWDGFTRAGCLASYGPRLADGYRRLAHYAQRIAQGLCRAVCRSSCRRDWRC
jgi:putative tryptophan/tyrosine transport system substrate-binding protein